MKYKEIFWGGVRVQDMEKSITFYRNVLGLYTHSAKTTNDLFYNLAGGVFTVLGGGKASSTPKTPAQQSLLISLGVDDLESVVKDLKDRGANFASENTAQKGDPWWKRSISLSDPEGNYLEISGR